LWLINIVASAELFASPIHPFPPTLGQMFGRRSVELEASDSADGQQRRKDERAETLFVQMLNRLFQAWGKVRKQSNFSYPGVS
jgi:hypothetical protein